MKRKKVKIKDLRVFIGIWTGIFVLLSLYPLVDGKQLRIWPLPIIFILLAMLAFFPKKVKGFYCAWVRFGEFVGCIISKVILFVIYFVLFTPIALVLKILGKDLLHKEIDRSKESYWVERKTQPESMKNQY